MIPNCVLTKKGAALLAKTPAGSPVPVTRWQLGTGALPADQSAQELTQLLRPLKYLPISSAEHKGSQCLVLGQFVNTGMEAFVWEELGLWATDPEEGEILYAVGNARGNGEAIQAGEEALREFIFGMELVFSGTANVTAVVDKTLVFATRAELEGLDYAPTGHDHDGRYFTKEETLSEETKGMLGDVSSPDGAFARMVTGIVRASYN